jgi:hypothetical protein
MEIEPRIDEKGIVKVTIESIIEKLARDGDLKEDKSESLSIFEVEEGDDLGFYQQGCEMLIAKMASESLKQALKIDALESRLDELAKIIESPLAMSVAGTNLLDRIMAVLKEETDEV